MYLSSIGNLHLASSYHHVYHRDLTPRLEQIVQGIKWDQACTRPARVCPPVTLNIMCNIYSVLSKNPNQYQEIMLWAACCTAFFDFLRIGEMTVPTQTAFNGSIHLSLRDVALDSRLTPTIVWLTIKQSKTDPFRKGARLCLSLTDLIVCPVKALLPYLALSGSDPSPLFCVGDKTPFTRVQFKNLLLATLRHAGLDGSPYNTQKFQDRGGHVSKGGWYLRYAYPTGGVQHSRATSRRYSSPHKTFQAAGICSRVSTKLAYCKNNCTIHPQTISVY